MASSTEQDVEQLLREFLRREVPHPWPPLKLPVRGAQPKSLRQRWLRQSHVSLAASIGFLLIGLGLTSQMLRGPDRGSGPAATSPIPAKAMKPTDKPYHKPATTPDVPGKEGRKSFTSPLSSLPH
jgi:hypothetical protein